MDVVIPLQIGRAVEVGEDGLLLRGHQLMQGHGDGAAGVVFAQQAAEGDDVARAAKLRAHVVLQEGVADIGGAVEKIAWIAVVEVGLDAEHFVSLGRHDTKRFDHVGEAFDIVVEPGIAPIKLGKIADPGRTAADGVDGVVEGVGENRW